MTVGNGRRWCANLKLIHKSIDALGGTYVEVLRWVNALCGSLGCSELLPPDSIGRKRGILPLAPENRPFSETRAFMLPTRILN
jgi:hypothetical protein